MKKIISFILVASMILSMFMINVSAASMTVSIDDKTVDISDGITNSTELSISLAGNTGFGSITLKVLYDGALLEDPVVEGKLNVLSNFDYSFKDDGGKRLLTIGYMENPDVTAASLDIANLKFTLKNTFQSGSTDIEFQKVEFVDGLDNDVACLAVNGKITVVGGAVPLTPEEEAAADKAAIEAASYTFAQADVPDEAAAKAALVEELNKLGLNNTIAAADITITNFVEAVAETSVGDTYVAGINGSFNYTVSIGGLATTAPKSCVIEYTEDPEAKKNAEIAKLDDILDNDAAIKPDGDLGEIENGLSDDELKALVNEKLALDGTGVAVDSVASSVTTEPTKDATGVGELTVTFSYGSAKATRTYTYVIPMVAKSSVVRLNSFKYKVELNGKMEESEQKNISSSMTVTLPYGVKDGTYVSYVSGKAAAGGTVASFGSVKIENGKAAAIITVTSEDGTASVDYKINFVVDTTNPYADNGIGTWLSIVVNYYKQQQYLDQLDKINNPVTVNP